MARVGIIGTGWGLMHLGAFRAAGADVVALCGRDPEKTRAVAEREGVGLGTTDVDLAIEASELVVVASPPDLHFAHVSAAIRAGRHVLCEKPITRSALEADMLSTIGAESASFVLAANFPMRRLDPLRRLKAAIDGGVLGRIHAIAATVTHGFGIERPTEDGLGRSGDFQGASHPVDTALWLARDLPKRIDATLPGEAGSGISLLISTERGTAVTVTYCCGAVPGIWGTWRLVGDAAEASFAAGYVPALGGWVVEPILLDGKIFVDRVASDPATEGSDPWFAAHVATAAAVLAAIEGGERDGLASFADGAVVQKVLVSAVDSVGSSPPVAI